MSIIELNKVTYELNKMDYIVFLINTERYDGSIDFSKSSDENFIQESLDQQYFYSLQDFQNTFNTDNIISTDTDYIRIIPVSRYLELMTREN